MNFEALLEKYAALAVFVGANVQHNQMVVIRSTTETSDLARAITKQAYLAGAKRVFVQWSDDYVSYEGLKHMEVETLEAIPQWQIDQTQYAVDEGACFISITSPVPGLNADLDSQKIQRAGIAMQKAMGFLQNHLMGNQAQWTIVAAPNAVWAKKVFPDLAESEAVEALWKAIFEASRVTEDNDPVKDWEEHNSNLAKHNGILNDYQFDYLVFKNALGTDVKVKLVDDHVWSGGGERTTKGVFFNPNIPTEETFTMPHKYGTEGKVVATKPLNYQGKLIEDFYLVFKEGKVVEFGAKKEEETLRNLIELDEGSAYIGEIALISYDSPISNTNILFYNTLFDENASCHMALGRAYPMNIENGLNMSLEELKEKGYNHSMAHSDFMFGSEDLSVIGVTKEGKHIPIFQDGNFII